MAIEVIAVGRLKDAGLQSLCDDYLLRLRRLAPTAVTEVKSADALRAVVWGKARRHVVLLDERGEAINTPAFATFVAKNRSNALTFCIGDAHGFNEDDRRRADRVLRLSDLTLPHRIARVVLVEQIYRAATIEAGHPYHHE